MDELLEAISTLVRLVSPEKVQAMATRIRQTDVGRATQALASVVGTYTANVAVERMIGAWQSSSVSSDEVASMLLAASHSLAKVAAEQSIELVWTGPTTPVVAARRTEQALLQVIDAAKQALFVTSFVAYDVSSIVGALNAASDRGVIVSMLLELSREHGGAITFDAIGKMKALIPAARLYAWRNRDEKFSDGRVHAKVAVADRHICFVTSANLTGFAMERNMEAGLLLSGGLIPQMLEEHLRALVAMKIVSQV